MREMGSLFLCAKSELELVFLDLAAIRYCKQEKKKKKERQNERKPNLEGKELQEELTEQYLVLLLLEFRGQEFKPGLMTDNNIMWTWRAP